MKKYRLYWGDLHAHSAASYGHGSPQRAIACAKLQLDFCSVTGHAFWPDMPDDRSRYAHIIDYHKAGFARCAENWPLLQQLAQAEEESGRFIPFLSYEWHSRAYGDHNVYFRDTDGPLVNGDSPTELAAKLAATGRAFMLVPHHIGYRQGYRGINWEHFSSEHSPLVEIFSMHGCSESDLAPYPSMHTMGPRDYRSTAEYGLKLGHRFGLIASTDHHAGFPGSYGDGRVGVWAEALTREALWDALQQRRTCAVTGDKIQALLQVNGAWPGTSIQDAQQLASPSPCDELYVEVVACDFVDYIEILRNERPVLRLSVPTPAAPAAQTAVEAVEVVAAAAAVATATAATATATAATVTAMAAEATGLANMDGRAAIEAKVRIEWGWAAKEDKIPIEASLTLQGGELLDIEPCFRGEAVLSPDDSFAGEERVPHNIHHQDDRSCSWSSFAVANPSPRQAGTQAVIATVRMKPADKFKLQMNGVTLTPTMRELLEGSISQPLRGYRSEAVRIHKAVPKAAYSISWQGKLPAAPGTTWYRLRVAQRNGQWAWTTPIWVER